MAQLFDRSISGTGSNAANIWIDLGVIPMGQRVRIGKWTVFGGKTETFNIYTNSTGQSSPQLSSCQSLGYISVRAGYTKTQDLYKRGTLYVATVIGTGTEHWWINIVARSATLATYSYQITYTLD